MLNQVVIVGRLTSDLTVKETESGKKVSNLSIAVPRTYKNEKGEYDTDFLDIVLWGSIAESTANYCKTGDIIGVKGRLQSDIYEKEDGTKVKKVDICAEKVTFLSSKARDDKGLEQEER